MNIADARKILGLGSAEDPRPYLADFKGARENIAAMVRSASSDTLADHYQKGLIEFDQALAAVQEHLEAMGVAAPPLPPKPPDPPVLATTPTVAESGTEGERTARPASRGLSYFAWFLIFLTGAAGGGWIYLKNEQAIEERRLIRLAFLERQGAAFIENRRWQDAATAFSEVETLSPGSDLAKRGRRSIEAGMSEEYTQFIGYWTGQAIAELESGRLEEATTSARQVLDRFPGEKEATDILAAIAAARSSQARAVALAAAHEALDRKDWELAAARARELLAKSSVDADANSILADAVAAIEKSKADRAKAAELFKMAAARDHGQFDQQALDWLREAKSLAPADAQIAALLEKLASYTRTLRVPGDFDTPNEALAAAQDGDRIVIGAAVWKGPLSINAGVEIQGAGFAETRIECPPETGSVITIGPDARGARVSGVTFRHESFAVGTERYSAATVRGGTASFVDCRFTEASGHGLAVVEGGQASISRSRFADNGWNGIAAIGPGSTLEVRDSESLNNFEHGIESWDGAAVILTNNRCESNSRNGIHADNGLASATIEGNQLVANREFGLVLASGGSGRVSGNTARANLLGGLVIRSAAAKLPVVSNQAVSNLGPGLVLERGLPADAYSANSVSQNSGRQILSGADLSTPSEP
ncbi:MAG: right-handed parallel beta-helix repeat-containing protein [Luteolibacter sp.]